VGLFSDPEDLPIIAAEAADVDFVTIIDARDARPIATKSFVFLHLMGLFLHFSCFAIGPPNADGTPKDVAHLMLAR
jgi:hypothetical protein